MDKTLATMFKNAVAYYWRTRSGQIEKQKSSGKTDQGARGAVTGGAQMDGFISAFTKIIIDKGIDTTSIFTKKSVALPGFYRPTKDWDLLVIRDDTLIAAIEAKSQVGPSFGNNFNNRIEEAWGARKIFGQLIEREHICRAHSHFWATSLCWKIALALLIRSLFLSPTSEYSRNLEALHTQKGTSSSAESSS